MTKNETIKTLIDISNNGCKEILKCETNNCPLYNTYIKDVPLTAQTYKAYICLKNNRKYAKEALSTYTEEEITNALFEVLL